MAVSTAVAAAMAVPSHIASDTYLAASIDSIPYCAVTTIYAKHGIMSVDSPSKLPQPMRILYLHQCDAAIILALIGPHVAKIPLMCVHLLDACSSILKKVPPPHGTSKNYPPFPSHSHGKMKPPELIPN